MANQRVKKSMPNRSMFYLSFWCAFAILSMILHNGLTDDTNQSFDEFYEDFNYHELERPSIKNMLKDVSWPFNETLTHFSHLLVDIFKMNDSSSCRNNEKDQRCVKDYTSGDPLEDNLSDGDWSSFDAAVTTDLKGLSTSQMISYFQDRYNNSDILPFVNDSLISISGAVTEAENHIAKYRKSVPIIVAFVSYLEEKSFSLGKEFIDSQSINSNRKLTLRQMETEKVKVAASLSKLNDTKNQQVAVLDNLHKLQKSQAKEKNFLGLMCCVLSWDVLALIEDAETAEYKIRDLVAEVKLSEAHLTKLQKELDSLLKDYEETETLAQRVSAEQLQTNSTLTQTKADLGASINDGVKMKKVTTFLTSLHGKLKVLQDFTVSQTPKDIIKAINVNDILEYFEKDEKSGADAITETLVAKETAHDFRRLIRSSREAELAESFAVESSDCPDCNYLSVGLAVDETDPFRRKRAVGVSDSDIETGDQMLMNISGVYQTFRKVMTDPDDFQWDQLFSATATGTAVLSDLILLAFSTPDIVLTRTRSFNPKKQHSTNKSGPESFRNILNRISHLQYSALVQHQSWLSQLQIMSLTLPDSLKTTIILLRALLGNPKNPTEPSPEITQLISLQLNNTLAMASETFRNRSLEIENTFQKLVDFATQLDGASITWKERRRITSNPCSSTVKAENNNVNKDEIPDSLINFNGIQQMIDGWQNLIASVRIVTRTVKELVIPELEAFQYLVEWSVQLATQRHEAGWDSESPALPLIHRIISQAAKVSRAVYLLHETNSVYLRVSTRHLTPQTINADEIMALDHPLSAQDLKEKRREIVEVGRREAESIAELMKEAKHQMIVKLTEHEKVRQPDNGNEHCSFEPKVGRKDIKDCIRERGCERYFLKSFVCA
ncbi:uncharacterized protein LOC124200855 [Daphnia pulex]|uniref:uncharacterized protein LOC124200855 n=1 Tax=Daphnia pulex TaxID=6669 RepID=UPI001EDFEC1F|nr:uncharacterized protein LOC124200855 [Daphnia pulex]